MTRLFIALIIPDEIKKLIFQFRDKAFPESVKYTWEPIEKIHLTLKFIGEVKDDLVIPITESINFLCKYESLNCELTKFGFFYRDNVAKILWIGMSIDEKIFDMIKELNEELKKLYIKVDNKKFIPHLTIKRLKGNEGTKLIKSFEEYKIPPIKFKATKIVLFRSRLSSGGSVYSEVNSYNLK